MKKAFGILFILTGVFAMAGGLYTWGEGSIFTQAELLKVLIPWADILLTGPISLAGGLGILTNRTWGKVLGLVTSGMYLLGSVLVFIMLYWNKAYTPLWIVPALFGFGIGAAFTIFVLKQGLK